MQQDSQTTTSSVERELRFDLESYCEENYKQAVLSLTWVETGRDQSLNRQLIFGGIEFVPRFLGNRIDTERFEESSSRLCHQRFILSPKEALALYKETSTTKRIPIRGTNEELSIVPHDADDTSIVETPGNGTTAYNAALPFLLGAYRYAGAQVSSIMPVARLQALESLATEPANAKWLKEHLLWDIAGNLEYLASFNLVLPNPYFTSIRARLEDHCSTATGARVEFFLNRDPAGKSLKLLAMERSNGYYGETHVMTLDRPSFSVDFSGYIEELEYTILDHYGRILHRSEFSPFLRCIVTNFSVSGGKVGVKGLDGKHRTFQRSNNSSIVCSSPDSESDTCRLSRKICDIRFEKKAAEEAKNQRFFHNEQAEAITLMQGIVNGAKKEVLIIDPYFSAKTAKWYIPLTNYDVRVKVICTCKAWFANKKEKSIAKYNALDRCIEELRHAGHEIEISLVHETDLHDRFICIDGAEAWIIGASMDKHNGKLTTVAKLQNGSGVAKYLGDYAKKAFWKPFEDWKAGER